MIVTSLEQQERLTKNSFVSMKSASVPLSSCERDFLLQGIRSRKVRTTGHFFIARPSLRVLILLKINVVLRFKIAFRWATNIWLQETSNFFWCGQGTLWGATGKDKVRFKNFYNPAGICASIKKHPVFILLKYLAAIAGLHIGHVGGQNNGISILWE